MNPFPVNISGIAATKSPWLPVFFPSEKHYRKRHNCKIRVFFSIIFYFSSDDVIAMEV